MEMIRRFLVENWRAKAVSLFIALSIWYLIRSHLDSDKNDFPVPGEPSKPVREDSILGPLIPTPPIIPVPGGDAKG